MGSSIFQATTVPNGYEYCRNAEMAARRYGVLDESVDRFHVSYHCGRQMV
jgi:hypothetical protein